ncbi:hypothetical protein Dsin_023517 [Dipteronia sinensis]|uniref:Uncharacterized protein n=1 Tax=Dipteronia sinensis TaxID=43782 RepID=A0AAE0A4C8_9ROSI|nr:hypothetical protein Dsin_023517 [Dipteronia sinensis]
MKKSKAAATGKMRTEASSSSNSNNRSRGETVVADCGVYRSSCGYCKSSHARTSVSNGPNFRSTIQLPDRRTTGEEGSVQISAQMDNRGKRYLSFTKLVQYLPCFLSISVQLCLEPQKSQQGTPIDNPTVRMYISVLRTRLQNSSLIRPLLDLQSAL